MRDFKNIEEVMNYAQSTVVIDLLPHALGLEERFLNHLREHEKGLYLPGSFEPTYYESKQYFRRKDMTPVSNGVPEIIAQEETSISKKAIKGSFFDATGALPLPLSTLPKIVDDIYDKDFNLVMSARDMSKFGRHLKPEPAIPSMAVRMAVGIVQTTVHNVCRHSTPCFNAHRPERLVKPEFFQEEDSESVLDVFEDAFEKLLIQVHQFIGDDHWNFYTYRLRGPVLIIQKGIDWRIFRYYEDLFEKQEKAAED